MSKQIKRETLLALVDAQLAKVKQAQADIKMLVAQIDGEWVIRKRFIRDVSWFGGSISEGFCNYAGYISYGPSQGNMGFTTKDVDQCRVFKSPRDAVFVAECLAGKEYKFETQDKYVIEIVDRLDGEVFAVIEKPWRHKDVK